MTIRQRLLLAAGISLGVALIALGVYLVRGHHRVDGGVILFVTSIVAFYLTDLLSVRFKLGWERSRGRGRMVALTFDDGPGELTSALLERLAKWEIKATFFFLGEQIEVRPALAREALARGHEIGGHGFTHRRWLYLRPSRIDRELAAMERAFARHGLPRPRYLRAPHGSADWRIRRRIFFRGYRLIGWTRGVWDSKKRSAAFMRKKATRWAREGEIILMHDGRHTAEREDFFAALDAIIAFYKALDFRFVTVSEWWPAEESRT